MCTMSGGKRTILQVSTKCTSIPQQMLFAKSSSEFVLKEKLKSKLREMPSSGSCITYKFLNSL